MFTYIKVLLRSYNLFIFCFQMKFELQSVKTFLLCSPFRVKNNVRSISLTKDSLSNKTYSIIQHTLINNRTSLQVSNFSSKIDFEKTKMDILSIEKNALSDDLVVIAEDTNVKESLVESDLNDLEVSNFLEARKRKLSDDPLSTERTVGTQCGAWRGEELDGGEIVVLGRKHIQISPQPTEEADQVENIVDVWIETFPASKLQILDDDQVCFFCINCTRFIISFQIFLTIF